MADESREQRLKRLSGNAKQAAKTGRAVPGRFIPLESLPDAVHVARESAVALQTFGGYEAAERVQPCFFPEDADPVFTAQWVKIEWNTRFAHPTHPELLGSLMGLGIDRAYFGDLIALEDAAYLYCLDTVAFRLPNEWTQAGRHTIRVSPIDALPDIALPAGETITLTVPSLRLDALLAAGLKLSRAKAQDLIRQGDVMINHVENLHTDAVLREQDLISVHRRGRIRLSEVRGLTRKDRISVTLTTMLHK
ncbi:MAG: hypothetical protein IJ708_09490 [Clostridia bacterium]|nr:hypothetical protein [Clostridia bacterium]